MATPARHRAWTPVRGFSLIELMVTIALTAVLALLSMPFTMRWVDSARQMEARNLLREAAGHARALSLRNPHHVPGNEAVARMSVGAGGALEVLQLVPDAADVVVWQGRMHPSLTFMTATGADFSCIAYNSRGARPALDVETDCVLDPRVRVVGRDPAEHLDVELL